MQHVVAAVEREDVVFDSTITLDMGIIDLTCGKITFVNVNNPCVAACASETAALRGGKVQFRITVECIALNAIIIGTERHLGATVGDPRQINDFIYGDREVVVESQEATGRHGFDELILPLGTIADEEGAMIIDGDTNIGAFANGVNLFSGGRYSLGTARVGIDAHDAAGG